MAELADILAGIQALSKDSQATRDLVLSTAKRLDSNIEDIREASMSTARELGGIQSSLKSMANNETRLEGRIAAVETKQAECPARQDHRAVNARLKKVENFKEKLQEERGEVTGVTHNPREFSAQPGLAAAVATATTKDIIIKAGPWIIAAILLGAAIGGFLLRGFLKL